MSAAPHALALLAPLDALRRAALRPLGPWLGRYYRDRALRVSLSGALSVTVVAALGLVAWALRDLAAARDAYIRLAAWHGGVELGAISLLACERSLRREGA